jgi:Domain of unknown function (DUF1844)
MSDTTSSGQTGPAPKAPADLESTELQSMLFLDMVAQQTNLALIFLGEVPHPETGKRVRDLRAARIFIDQLEMLEAKTRGNLDKREEALLKQSLMTTRMAFVTAARQEPAAAQPGAAPVTTPPSAGSGQASDAASSTSEPPASATASAPDAPAAAATPDEERKKFVKKY